MRSSGAKINLVLIGGNMKLIRNAGDFFKSSASTTSFFSINFFDSDSESLTDEFEVCSSKSESLKHKKPNLSISKFSAFF